MCMGGGDSGGISSFWGGADNAGSDMGMIKLPNANGGWKDILGKAAGGFQKGAGSGIASGQQIQGTPFSFSPLTQPNVDPNSNPLTQSIIARIMAQIGAGNSGGY